MTDQRARVQRLSLVLRSVAAAGPLRVGFPSPGRVGEAYELLRGYGFRKPWFKSRREWARSAILEPAVYEAVWPHVQLECIVAGTVRYFSGSGSRRRANPNVAALEARLPRILWSIDLGLEYQAFAGALDIEPSPAIAHDHGSQSGGSRT
jgi:hypothetical protein